MPDPAPTKIIAMWSGPRNLSTAMMRSFAQRADTKVWDEPFYAAYLRSTGIDHPMREAIIAEGIARYEDVIDACLERAIDRSVFYQKHMTQHMIDGVDLSWIDGVTNAFLIRAPERVLASYAAKRAEVCAADLGYAIQRRMFDRIAEKTGRPPIVIDSNDVRASPKIALTRLCDGLGIAFDPAMLGWPAGPSKDDGIWAKHWYDAIWKSTGFAPPETALPEIADHLRPIVEEVLADYHALRAHKISID